MATTALHEARKEENGRQNRSELGMELVVEVDESLLEKDVEEEQTSEHAAHQGQRRKSRWYRR